jgi:CO/xanthine dehydrogenase Mo-binding subunit
MIATIPPRGHHADARVTLEVDGSVTIGVGTAEFGNGSATAHVQLVAEELRGLGVDPSRITLHGSDTDAATYDTGAYGSTGTVVAGQAVAAAARDLRRLAEEHGYPLSRPLTQPLTGVGEHHGTPRSCAFNVQGFRVAVDPGTGEVRILKSVQAVDAGTVINPEQLRGQVEGGVGQGIGSSLYEEVQLVDGEVVTRTLRSYRVPQLGDLPPTEVLFADTHDPLGPHGAKSMSEAPYNPVAPALANAVRDATGVRPHELPISRDRVWRLLTSSVPPADTPQEHP